MKGIPRHGIGRGFKAVKEEVLGLLTALTLFAQKDHLAEMKRFEKMMMRFSSKLQGLEDASARFVPSSHEEGIPCIEIRFGDSYHLKDLVSLVRMLRLDDPPIYLDEARLNEKILRVDPFDLQPDDLPIIGGRIKDGIKEVTSNQQGRAYSMVSQS